MLRDGMVKVTWCIHLSRGSTYPWRHLEGIGSLAMESGYCRWDGLSSIGARAWLTNLCSTVGCFHQWVKAIVVAVTELLDYWYPHTICVMHGGPNFQSFSLRQMASKGRWTLSHSSRFLGTATHRCLVESSVPRITWKNSHWKAIPNKINVGLVAKPGIFSSFAK